MTPFYASLNRTMYYTLCRIAERAGLAHKEPRRLITNPEFWAEFCERVVDVKIKPGKSVAKIQKGMFKVCHEIVKMRYSPFFGQKNGPVKVDRRRNDSVRFSVVLASLSKNPLSWVSSEAQSTAAGEAETSSAGEHLVKE